MNDKYNAQRPYPLRSSRRHFIRALLLATAGVLIITGASFGATLAYFSAKQTTPYHIKAGSLDIGFYYDGVYNKVVQDNATALSYVTKEEGTLANPIDLTQTSDSVFHVDNAMPGLDMIGMFHIENVAKVDFAYYVGFEGLTYDAEDEASAALADALVVTLYKGDGTEVHHFKASEITDPNNLNYLMANPIHPEGTDTFEVRCALDYETVGNEIQNGELSFNVYVDARSMDVETTSA